VAQSGLKDPTVRRVRMVKMVHPEIKVPQVFRDQKALKD
jgi:hypothetical protein